MQEPLHYTVKESQLRIITLDFFSFTQKVITLYSKNGFQNVFSTKRNPNIFCTRLRRKYSTIHFHNERSPFIISYFIFSYIFFVYTLLRYSKYMSQRMLLRRYGLGYVTSNMMFYVNVMYFFFLAL